MDKIDKFIVMLKLYRKTGRMSLFLYIWCKYIIVPSIWILNAIKSILTFIIGIYLLMIGMVIDLILWSPLIWVLSKFVTIERVDIYDDAKCK